MTKYLSDAKGTDTKAVDTGTDCEEDFLGNFELYNIFWIIKSSILTKFSFQKFLVLPINVTKDRTPLSSHVFVALFLVPNPWQPMSLLLVIFVVRLSFGVEKFLPCDAMRCQFSSKILIHTILV